MDINTLQYVVGEVKADAPATIRFFGSVTKESTSRFNDEFDSNLCCRQTALEFHCHRHRYEQYRSMQQRL